MDRASITEWKARLSTWCTPTEFKLMVEDCRKSAGRFGTLTHHGMGFWRDAWLAAEHAVHLRSHAVQLIHPREFPDYAMKIGNAVFEFEATEAIRPERRRADEFRQDLVAIEQGQSANREHPFEEWLTPKLAFSILRSRSENKARKSYANRCGLLIYLNESEYGSNEQAIRNVFGPATEAAGKTFLSVDILWNSQFHRVWLAGLPS